MEEDDYTEEPKVKAIELDIEKKRTSDRIVIKFGGGINKSGHNKNKRSNSRDVSGGFDRLQCNA